MISRISNAYHIPFTKPKKPTQKGNSVIDVHNISPNEMGNLATKLYEKGEISGKVLIALLPLDTKPLSQALGREIHLKYRSRVWDNPNQKRDMLAEFKAILQEQIRDNDELKNIIITKSAISALERIDRQAHQPSFQATLETQVNSPLV